VNTNYIIPVAVYIIEKKNISLEDFEIVETLRATSNINSRATFDVQPQVFVFAKPSTNSVIKHQERAKSGSY